MTRMLHRLGGSTAAHPWRTFLAWVLALVVAGGLVSAVGGTPQDDWNVPGLRSQAGTELLREEFPAASGAADRVVVHDRDGSLDRAAVEALSARLADMPHVVEVSAPRESGDGTAALIEVRYDAPVTHADLFGNLEPLEQAVEPARAAGLQVELGGDVPENATEIGGTGEMIGIAVALVLLVLTFGSILAAGVPVLVALVGLALGSSGVLLLAGVTDVSTSAPTVATMVGLGVGIDYALLLATRHVEFLRAGHTVREAAARATATAGRSVVFAGATVLVSLMGLRLANLSTYSSFGFATAIVVVTVMAAALTLVPALLGLLEHRVLPRRTRKGRPARTAEPFTARWARRVGRRPLPWAVAATTLLLVLAAPVTEMRMWPSDTGVQPADTTTRKAYDLVAEKFGPGANGPFVVAIDLEQVDASTLPSLVDDLAATPGVAAVSPPAISPTGTAATVFVEPTTGPSDELTVELVDRLRDDVLPIGAELTGTVPVYADITDMLAERIWIVIAFVVGLSVLLLTVMFRSVAVPLKAAVMNLLSIGAAYGVMVAVFQWGWGAGALGLDHAVPVSSWIPILMFAVAFGLSMDYEVFLLSRVREEWLRTGDARRSVVTGLASTGRIISAAAAIMVAVFLGFATEGDLVVKQIGIGLAVAILVDATVVRMVLVPATMALLGRWNWWLPRWLDRVLPHLDAEVHDVDLPAQRPASSPERVPAGVR